MFSTADLIPLRPFLGSVREAETAKLILFGCPFDGTCSYRPGARFGPAAVREVSDALETYCPVLKADLEEVPFFDAGDLNMPPGDVRGSLDMAYRMAAAVYSNRQIPAAIGGEHLISLPLVRAALESEPDLVIVHFDAHFDLRNQYLGVELSHATVLRRIVDLFKPSRILHVGQRSGVREEFTETELQANFYPATTEPDWISKWIGDRPVYVTVDLDVLDPSIFPGTGTPEPGGVSFTTLQNWIAGLATCRWVGWDVVELSPTYDPTGVSSIVAAKIVRTMVLASLSGCR
ncbi:MAG: agmatinase [bacterium]|nr:agmatinase [bacterium]